MWADFYLAFNISSCIIDGFKGGMIKYKERHGSVAAGIVNHVFNTGQKNTPLPEYTFNPTLCVCTLYLHIWQMLLSDATCIAFKAFILQVGV